MQTKTSPTTDPDVLKQGQAVMRVLDELGNLTPQQQVAVLMVANAKAIERLMYTTGTPRGRIINAATADYRNNLQKHVGIPSIHMPAKPRLIQ